MKAGLFFLLLFFTIACDHKDNNPNTVTAPPATTTVGSRQAIEKFYNWYIDSVYIPITDKNLPDYYQPEIKEVGSKSYTLDTTSYFKLLRNSICFQTNSFHKNGN